MTFFLCKIGVQIILWGWGPHSQFLQKIFTQIYKSQYFSVDEYKRRRGGGGKGSLNTDFLSEQTLVPFRWQSRCLCCTAETEEKYQTKSVKEEVLRTGRICNCSPHKTK